MPDSATVERPQAPEQIATPETVPVEVARTMSDAERKAMLAQSVANEVRKQWRVQSQTDFQAVMEKGKRTSHGLHLFLSIITLGLWLPVWALMIFLNRDQSEVIAVDPYGNVNITK